VPVSLGRDADDLDFELAVSVAQAPRHPFRLREREPAATSAEA
jgi:hypothetical protein